MNLEVKVRIKNIYCTSMDVIGAVSREMAVRAWGSSCSQNPLTESCRSKISRDGQATRPLLTSAGLPPPRRATSTGHSLQWTGDQETDKAGLRSLWYISAKKGP